MENWIKFALGFFIICAAICLLMITYSIMFLHKL